MDITPLYPIFPVFGLLWFGVVLMASMLIINSIFFQPTLDCYNRIDNFYVQAYVSCLLAIIILSAFGSPPLISYILKAPVWVVVVGFLSYVMMGIGVSLLQWKFFCMNQFEVFQNFKRTFLQKRNIDSDEVPEEELQRFNTALMDEKPNLCRKINGVIHYGPDPYKYKHWISAMMFFWPWCLIWLTTNDFVRYFYLKITKSILFVFNSVSINAFNEGKKQ